MRLGFTLAVLLLSTLAHAQPIIGDRAPALNVLTLSDGGFSLSGRKGQVTIVDFSATWPSSPPTRAYASSSST